jgi:hypothetical protein
MTDLYYTVTHNEIRSSMPDVPVLVSAAGWTFQRKNGTTYLRKPPLPDHVVKRAGDCGGIAAATRWGGKYRFKPRQYVDWLMKWKPQWAATMDLCCVDLGEDGRPHYPGKKEVERRQKYTTEMASYFWAMYQYIPLTWVVTIQGWHPEEYVQHASILAPLIREMAETYFDPASSDEDGQEYVFRVGIGSLCWHDPLLVHEIVCAVQDVIGLYPLQLWGKKLDLLRSPIDFSGITSVDSSAWNGLWGPEHEARRQSGLSEARYCWEVSYPSYAERVATALQQPKFSPLIDTSTVPVPLLQAAKASQASLPDGLCYQRSGEGPGEQQDLSPLL